MSASDLSVSPSAIYRDPDLTYVDGDPFGRVQDDDSGGAGAPGVVAATPPPVANVPVFGGGPAVGPTGPGWSGGEPLGFPFGMPPSIAYWGPGTSVIGGACPRPPSEYWADGGISCNGGYVGGDPPPPHMPGQPWDQYVGSLTPGQLSQVMNEGGIPASALEKDPGLLLQVQTKLESFNQFLQTISNLLNAQHQTGEAIARNIQG